MFGLQAALADNICERHYSIEKCFFRCFRLEFNSIFFQLETSLLQVELTLPIKGYITRTVTPMTHYSARRWRALLDSLVWELPLTLELLICVRISSRGQQGLKSILKNTVKV